MRDGIKAIGSGYREQDLINYPHIYLYDDGVYLEEPEKGNLNYEHL